MAQRNTVAHALHDIGLAAWFGGSLMGAIGVNGAAADVDDPRQRARVANAGWNRWTPFNLVAIGAHLVGGAQLLKANKGRVATHIYQGTHTVTRIEVPVLGILTLRVEGGEIIERKPEGSDVALAITLDEAVIIRE